MILFGSLSPTLLQKCADNTNLLASVRAVIDSMVVAAIRKEGYEARRLRKKI